MTVDVNDADRAIYERELREFLPARVFDAHVHLFDRDCLKPDTRFPATSCYQKFGGVFTLEQYRDWIERLLPAQDVSLCGFGHPFPESDLDASADYLGSVADGRRVFGLALVSPRDTAEAVIRRVTRNRLCGYKPYPALVEGKAPADVTLFDMLPAAHMEAADARGLAVTVHIPRPGRLADPLNQAQMVELCRRYPRAQIIFAHVGRAYFLSGVTGLLDGLASCPNAYVDTAMVNHEGVLEHAFRRFPRERILFGSDAPIAFLRGKSVEVNNQYAYLMGEPYDIGSCVRDSSGALAYTFFFYEQLRGLKLGAERAGLSRREVEGLFFNNADRLFRAAAGHAERRRT
jgi:predicted TIM-barrel fold metal-dependent hydrolase